MVEAVGKEFSGPNEIRVIRNLGEGSVEKVIYSGLHIMRALRLSRPHLAPLLKCYP